MASLRPAIAADLPRIGAVHVQAWQEAYADILPRPGLARMTAGRAAAQWHRLLEPGDMALIVVQEGPRILGFGSAGPQRSPGLRDRGFAGEVSTLYLLREAQGRGLGRTLLAALAGALRVWGLRGMALWVLEENRPARAFYRHMGGTEIARQKDRWGGAVVDELAYGWRDLSALSDATA
ncbi:MAG: GNAT family N-acetyltransferase [Pseudomonadota bacterium]